MRGSKPMGQAKHRSPAVAHGRGGRSRIGSRRRNPERIVAGEAQEAAPVTLGRVYARPLLPRAIWHAQDREGLASPVAGRA